MIAEDASIDPLSVFSVLFRVFGSEFCDATLDQRLVLLEAVAYSLRQGGDFYENLRGVAGCGPEMPPAILGLTGAKLPTNEGLKLMVAIHVAIVEGYSVAATAKN